MEATTTVLIIFLTTIIIVVSVGFWFIIKKISEPVVPEKDMGNIEKLNEVKAAIKEDYNKLMVELTKVSVRSENNAKLSNDFSSFKDSHSETKKIINNLSQDFSNFNNAYENDNKTLKQSLGDLSKVFSNFKDRGKLGENALYFITESIIGTENKELIKKQHMLSNGKIPDLFIKGEDFGIVIDSKLPLEKFTEYLNLKDGAEMQKRGTELKKEILTTVTAYIKELSKKYLLPDDGVSSVLLFIPSQSLFDMINNDNYFSFLIKLCINQKVYICSPSTLPAHLNLIISFNNKNKMIKNITTIHKNIETIKKNFELHSERWGKIDRKFETLAADVKNFNISDTKIKKNFKAIVTSQKTLNSGEE